MPTTSRDARFVRAMVALLLTGCALLLLGALLTPSTDITR